MEELIEAVLSHMYETVFLTLGVVYGVMFITFIVMLIKAIKEKKSDSEDNGMEQESNISLCKWQILAGSVIGQEHTKNEIPCQDSHRVENFGQGWGIAVVSDGLSSAARSDIGSGYIVDQAAEYLKEMISKEKWIEDNRLPSSLEWTLLSIQMLHQIHQNLSMFAEKNRFELESLAATIIAVVYSPFGLLITHMGDGRAGYRSRRGEWKSMMKPINGETTSEVMPITAPIWEEIRLIFQFVESRVIDEPVDVFTLMSDGCEDFCYETVVKDENGHGKEVNKPHKEFFEPILEWAKGELNRKSKEEVNSEWCAFLMNGNERIACEGDDKTLIIGYCLSKEEKNNEKV